MGFNANEHLYITAQDLRAYAVEMKCRAEDMESSARLIRETATEADTRARIIIEFLRESGEKSLSFDKEIM